MRYLCGHGRGLSCDVAGSDGGIAAALGAGCGAEESSSGHVEAGCERNGLLFVGPPLTKCVMSSGTFAGETLSMNCHDGSRSTVELWSEWSGTGMLEADSMSLCEVLEDSRTLHTLKWGFTRLVSDTHPVARLYVSLVHRLHDAALLIGNISHPVAFPRRHEKMGIETLDMAVQLLRLINVEFARVFYAATGAVVQTVVAINGRVGSRK